MSVKSCKYGQHQGCGPLDFPAKLSHELKYHSSSESKRASNEALTQIDMITSGF